MLTVVIFGLFVGTVNESGKYVNCLVSLHSRKGSAKPSKR